MANGTVLFFSNQKSYGFIQTDDSENFFVHFSAVKTKGVKILRARSGY
jgi:cold shock protein